MALDVVKHVDVEVFRANTQVGLLINEDFQWVKAGDEDPLSDVELTVLDEGGFLNVLLHYFGTHLLFVLVTVEGFS